MVETQISRLSDGRFFPHRWCSPALSCTAFGGDGESGVTGNDRCARHPTALCDHDWDRSLGKRGGGLGRSGGNSTAQTDSIAAPSGSMGRLASGDDALTRVTPGNQIRWEFRVQKFDVSWNGRGTLQ